MDAGAGPASTSSSADLTAADVVARWLVNYDRDGVGLRGGRWAYAGYPNVRFRLTNVQLVPGVLEVRGPGGMTGTVVLAYPKEPGATATLTGMVGGRALRATMPAP